jgi:group I intron endonuclease
MVTGIYLIRNRINNKKYIGQSIRLTERKQDHFHTLRNNTHHNTHLQNAFNIYGENNFEFKIIYECNPEELNELEEYFIDLYDAYTDGYNMTVGGENCPDNTNEHHGMWRHDIHTELLKRMYLQGKNTTELGEIFQCSRRTIERRLHKAMPPDELKKIRYKRASNSLLGRPGKKANDAPNYREDVPLGEELYQELQKGAKQVDLAKKYNCTQATISDRIVQYKRTLPEKYIRRTKRENELWDHAVVEYCKADICKNGPPYNPCRCFVFKLNGVRYTDIRSMEWYSFELIADLVEEILQEEGEI